MRPSRIRTTASGLVLTLLLTLLTASPASADTDDPPTECGPVQDAEAAAARALACDIDVEVLGERTSWDTVHATPEGTIRHDSSIAAVRTDINGSWEAIDTTLTHGSGEGITVAAPVHAMTFSDGSPGQPLAAISTDERTLTIDPPLALTTPTIQGSTITYPEVLQGVDLILQVHPDGTGFSQVFRVESPEAAANAALAQLEFGLQAIGDLTIIEHGDGFTAQDSYGQEVFVAPTPIMWDSASTQAPAPAGAAMGTSTPSEPVISPADGDTIATMETTLSHDAITIEPDQAMLTSDDTVWPVYIDPTISGSQSGRTIVRSGFPTDTSFYNWTGDQGLGYCATSGGCTRNGVYRMLFKFGGLGTIGNLTAADVISATFSVYGQHTWACTATGVQLWRTGAISSSTTWNTQPAWSSQLQAKNLIHKSACADKPRWIEWNATAAAKYTATNSQSTMSLGLRTSNETSMASSWQRYRHDAKLSITYSRVPGAGTAQATTPATTCSVSNPAYLRTTTPQFRWKVSDPDGGNVTGNLDIYRVTSGSTLIWNPNVATQASGTQFSMTPPSGTLANGHTYEWRTGGIDVPTGRAGPTTSCRIIIDTTAPPASTILPSTVTMPATYPADTISGGVGQEGRFRIENTATDVAHYRYSFNSDALGSTVTASNSVAGINFTPTTPGSQRLLVQAVDKAGNVGPTSTYRFSVSFPSTTARWELDDATGTTGTDNAGTNHLTISASTTWTNGVRADLISDPDDTALLFDGITDQAVSSGPAVNTSASYTVMAFVNADALTTSPHTAVSQDGQIVSAFQLGALPPSYCDADGQPCWYMQIRTTDTTASSYLVRATSTMAATTGQWMHLTGTVDTVNDTVSLYVCDPTTTDGPVLAGHAAITTPITWAGGGSVQLGRGYSSQNHGNHWQGRLDDVRIFDNVIPLSQIRNSCWES